MNIQQDDFGPFHDSFQHGLQPAINTGLSNVFYPTEWGVVDGTVDTIHLSVCLEGEGVGGWVQGRLELVALVFMKS